MTHYERVIISAFCPMLSRRHKAVFEALLPGINVAGEKRLTLADAEFEAFYRDLRKKAPFPVRLATTMALFVILWIAPLFAGKLPPLSRHTEEARIKILTQLSQSRFYLLRQLIMTLKLLACLCYGGNEKVRHHIGYPASTDLASQNKGW